MSNIAGLIGIICACSLAVSALSLISPNGITSKTLNLVTGVFIICVMLVPIKNFITDFDFKITSPEIPGSISSDAREAYNSAVITETKNRLEKSLLSTLLSEDYKVDSVDIKLSENEDGGIYISGIVIYIDKTEKRLSKIIRRAEEIYSVTPKITVR